MELPRRMVATSDTRSTAARLGVAATRALSPERFFSTLPADGAFTTS